MWLAPENTDTANSDWQKIYSHNVCLNMGNKMHISKFR